MQQTLIPNKLGLEILTDSGWQRFDGIVYKGVKHTITIHTATSNVTLTPDHKVFLETLDSLPAGSLKVGDVVLTLSGPQPVTGIRENCLEKVFDVVNAGENYRFFANAILCSNCEFIVAEETLINSMILPTLEGKEPISRTGQVRWYDNPKKGRLYTVALDPSLGTGGDPAAIQVFEADTTTQIGEWKHNKTDIPGQIKLLAQICNHIAEVTGEPNNIYYSIENNSIGEAALISLAEYGEAGIAGSMLSEPGKTRKGFTTTQRSKLAACAKFKTLVENKKMKINSFGLISEMKSFIASGGSYAAKIGDTDDLVMAALLSVRMFQVLSEYHSDLETRVRDYDEVISPLPFFAIFG